MSILTLAPSRTSQLFVEGSYAYAYADHGVRQNGVLITPVALTAMAADDGVLSFDLVASDKADDCEPFTYTVAAFDPDGRRMWIANILMPDTDTAIWSLIPKTVDPDLRSAAAAVVDEPDVYCGTEPVAPVIGTDLLLLNGGVLFGVNGEENTLQFSWPENADSTATPLLDLLSVGDSFIAKITAIDNDQPQLSVKFAYLIVNPFGTPVADPLPDPVADLVLSGTSTIFGSAFTVGQYVEIAYSQDADGYDVLSIINLDYPYIEGSTQADIDTYNAAKATYDQCIASGGIAGRDPSAMEPEPDVYCGVEPVDPTLTPVELTTGWDASRSGTANGGTVVLSENDARAVISGASTSLRRILVAASEYDMSEGNWYWEITFQSYGGVSGTSAGIADPENIPPSGIVGFAPFSAGVFPGTGSFYNGSSATTIGEYSRTTTLRFNLNADTREFYVANEDGPFVLQSTVEPSIVYSPALHTADNADVNIVLSSDDFTYDIPTGAKALADQLGPEQSVIDAYTEAKATYDQCIADGGIPGEQP